MIACVIGLIFCIYAISIQNELKEKHSELWKNYIDSLENFTISHRIDAPFFILLFDDSQRKFIIIKFTIDGELVDNKFSYDEIMSIEVIKNGRTCYTRSFLDTTGRAIVGGALAGNVGGLIGGITSSTTSKEIVSEIIIKWHIRNIDCPTVLGEIHKGSTIESTDYKYTLAMEKADEIIDLFSVIIDNVNRNCEVKEELSMSIADELHKMLKLKDQGILTEDEFEKQKQRLLQQIDTK